MRRALVLLALAACGDNLGSSALDPDFGSSFDDAATLYWGEVYAVAPPAPLEPIADASVCFEGDGACTTTDDDGAFQLADPDAAGETVVEVSAPDTLPARIAVRHSVAGDRFIGPILMLTEDVIDLRASDFDVDPRLDSRGVVLMLGGVYGEGTVTLSIDDATTAYVGQDGIPDPSQEALGPNGVAVFFAVPAGEILLRSTAGRCEATFDGWPTGEPGTIRLPVSAGAMTIVHPLCTAD